MHGSYNCDTTIYLAGDKEFFPMLQRRFNLTPDLCIRDIYDGEAYVSLMSPGGFLTSPTNITLLMNTDGAQVFHSSTVSMWPVFFVINELPPHIRYIHTLQLQFLMKTLWILQIFATLYPFGWLMVC